MKVYQICAALAGIVAATVISPAATPIARAGSEPCVFTFEPPTPVEMHGAVVVGGYVDCRPGVGADFSITLTLELRDRNGNWLRRDWATSHPGAPNPRLNIAVRDLDCTPALYRGVFSMRYTNFYDATEDTLKFNTQGQTPPTIIRC